jgi:hypothetical protein
MFMRGSRLFLLGVLFSTASAYGQVGQSVGGSSIPASKWATQDGNVSLANFRFGTGESLPELKLHYLTLGEPHHDAAGHTDNAILLLHGTGGNEDDLLPLGQELDPSANILSPRGKVRENGMPRFFRRFAEGVFDVAGVFAGMVVLTAFVIAIDGMVTRAERRLLVWRPVVAETRIS